jgi:hypothetical protein
MPYCYITSGLSEYVVSRIETKTGLDGDNIAVALDAGDEIEITVTLYYPAPFERIYDVKTLTFHSFTQFETYLKDDND